MDAALIDTHTIAKLPGRRVLWNGSCESPYYHLLCDVCGWLSPALLSTGDALDAGCGSCAAQRDGRARLSAFEGRARRAAARRRLHDLRARISGPRTPRSAVH